MQRRKSNKAGEPLKLMSVRCPQSLYERLHAVSDETQISVSGLVIGCTESVLDFMESGNKKIPKFMHLLKTVHDKSGEEFSDA
jgi:hypothetical protein